MVDCAYNKRKKRSIEAVAEHVDLIQLGHVLLQCDAILPGLLDIAERGDGVSDAEKCLIVLLFEVGEELLARDVVFLPLEHFGDEGLGLLGLAVDDAHQFLQLSEGELRWRRRPASLPGCGPSLCGSSPPLAAVPG